MLASPKVKHMASTLNTAFNIYGQIFSILHSCHYKDYKHHGNFRQINRIWKCAQEH